MMPEHWEDELLRLRVERELSPPRDGGRWQVRLPTRDGEVLITAPNSVSADAMRCAMWAYWGEKT